MQDKPDGQSKVFNATLTGDESYLESTRFSDIETAGVEPPVLESNDELRYSVFSVLVATTLVALAIVLLKRFSVFGVLIIFAITLIADVTLRAKAHPARLQIARGLWGIVMPILCIIFDPGFLHRSWYDIDALLGASNGSDVALLERIFDDRKGLLLLPPILLQCCGLAIWLLFKKRIGFSPFVAGFFVCGAAIAAAIGLVILPISLIAMLAAGIGLLGLTPFWTSVTYMRVASAITRSKPADRGRTTDAVVLGQWFWGVLGFATALALPLSFSMFLSWADSGYLFDAFAVNWGW